MTKNDIKTLMKDKKTLSKVQEKIEPKKEAQNISSKPILSSSIKEYFSDSDINSQREFYPYLYGEATLRFYNQKRSIDTKEKLYLKLDFDESVKDIEFENAYEEELIQKNSNAKSSATYAKTSPLLSNEKSLRKFEKKLSDFIYHSKRIELFTCKELKLESTLGQNKRDFLIDVKDALKEKREMEIEKLQKRFKTKYSRLEDKFEKLQIKLQKEEADVSSKVTDTLISVGAALFGAFFSKKKLSVTNINRASSSFKKGKGVLKERNDVKNTQGMIDSLELDIEKLQEVLLLDIEKIQEKINIENYEIGSFSIKPRRTDISIEDFALLWER